MASHVQESTARPYVLYAGPCVACSPAVAAVPVLADSIRLAITEKSVRSAISWSSPSLGLVRTRIIPHRRFVHHCLRPPMFLWRAVIRSGHGLPFCHVIGPEQTLSGGRGTESSVVQSPVREWLVRLAPVDRRRRIKTRPAATGPMHPGGLKWHTDHADTGIRNGHSRTSHRMTTLTITTRGRKCRNLPAVAAWSLRSACATTSRKPPKKCSLITLVA